ncbi:MAG TPA: BBP7 family outer membrane beta-barrel protein [Pirellulales bacterium]|jgi:hypothetical protein|nr:BBP7 family outer membrane beta-barrel protein [Pirellulales bacterium]
MRFVAMLSLLVALLRASSVSAGPFDPNDDDPSAWCRLEYLNLWTSHAALPAPLVSTGDASSLGRLGSPGTQPLFGPGSLPAPVFPAIKLTIGGWLYDNLLGGEFSIFGTTLRATHFGAASNASGSPLLAIPFADVTSGTARESSLVVSRPGVASGRAWADDAMGLLGFDFDGLASLDEHVFDPDASLAMIGGLRVLGFRERFKFSSGTDFLSGPSISHNDIFLTNSAFIGLDLGMRGGYRLGRWTIQATGRTALGVTSSLLDVAAQDSLQMVTPRLQTVPGEGWFAQPSNIGWYYRQAFSVVPAAQLRVSYALTNRVHLTIGYEAFYWTRMLRAPNQLDRDINLSQLVGPRSRPARPAAGANFSNFWAQGFTAGVQVNF